MANTQNAVEDDDPPATTLVFEVLIDESFANICLDQNLTPTENKNVLSIINDYEDAKWRQTKFSSFIWDNIAETALSFQDREALIGKSHSELVEAAKKLRLVDAERDEIGKGSELAEIALYGIMKQHYGALPVVPKIFYKQNTQDNAKGPDSVHIVVDDDGSDFTVWFGEAKFYSEIENVRLDAIVASIATALQTDKLKKENSIITSVSDIDYLIPDTELRTKIKSCLSHKASIDALKPRLNIPILILHECPITRTNEGLTEEYRQNIRQYHRDRAEAYFKKQIRKCGELHKYSEIRFHIILFPVPEKEALIRQFLENVVHYRRQ